MIPMVGGMDANEIRALPDHILEALAICAMTGATSRPLGEILLDRRDPTRAVTVIVDLDGLKTVNDTEGHAAGDLLLTGAGAILRMITRPGDLIIRTGGDEFLVHFRSSNPWADWRQIERRFREAFDGRHGVLASCGVAPGVLDRSRADDRMYADKRRRALKATAVRIAPSASVR